MPRSKTNHLYHPLRAPSRSNHSECGMMRASHHRYRQSRLARVSLPADDETTTMNNDESSHRQALSEADTFFRLAGPPQPVEIKSLPAAPSFPGAFNDYNVTRLRLHDENISTGGEATDAVHHQHSPASELHVLANGLRNQWSSETPTTSSLPAAFQFELGLVDIRPRKLEFTQQNEKLISNGPGSSCFSGDTVLLSPKSPPPVTNSSLSTVPPILTPQGYDSDAWIWESNRLLRKEIELVKEHLLSRSQEVELLKEKLRSLTAPP